MLAMGWLLRIPYGRVKMVSGIGEVKSNKKSVIAHIANDVKASSKMLRDFARKKKLETIGK